MKNFEYIYYSTPNTKVIENLDDEERADASLVPPDSATENCEVAVRVPDEINTLMSDLWKQLKSE